MRLLVEEAFRSNAGIVGPKLVEADNPEVLLDVGRAIDRLGGSHTGIEPGEVDQEQHDGVRDVFYVSSAAMLVRADLFAELGGFDPDTFPGSEDLDLCWRARLAGARVMVAPDARGRHHEASEQRTQADRPDVRDVARNRVRVLLTCYSLTTLLWVIPVGLVLSLVELVVYLPTRRRSLASASVGAWWWNVLHLGRLSPARKRAQAARTIPDAELRALQVGPSARFGAFLTQHNAEERLQSIGERSRDAFQAIADALRHPASLFLALFALLLVVGSRTLLSSGVPQIGTMVEWPGVRAIGDAFGSAWRSSGMGSTAAAPPAFVMMGGLGTVLFGSMGLARTLVVVVAFVFGSLGAFPTRTSWAAHGAVRSARRLRRRGPRNAVAGGRAPTRVLRPAPFHRDARHAPDGSSTA